jgi:hypothetical protein
MEKNQLFLVLPLISVVEQDEECVYLKVVDADSSKDVFVTILKHLIEAFDWTKGESFDLYYDHQRFLELYKKSGLESVKQIPSPLQLLGGLCQLTKIPRQMAAILVNRVSLTHGILCYHASKVSEGGALIDHNAIRNKEYLEVFDSNGNSVSHEIIDCNRDALYKWFVSNRFPARIIDTSYKKHGAKPIQVGSHLVSGRSYKDEEYSIMLQWAVGNNASRRKYYMDFKKGRLVIFWNENLAVPTYHCYDVDINDPEENSKMMKDCNRSLIDQIKSIGLK